MSNMRIAFIGAGNMASSLIGGLLAKGLDAARIRASDPGAETRARVSAEHGIELFADNAQAVQDADVIVIAVKPQVMKAVCQDLRAHLKPHQLLISIAAGITFVPGEMFSASGRYKNYMRLACGLPWNERIDDAVKRLGKLVTGVAGNETGRAAYRASTMLQ